ncbi:hypothetical protein ACE5IS_15320 [Leptospira wolffii]|uniref:DNA alkylation repair protein n=1 Tax=Leptospira wolffii TaxID=409998 RepID=A0ABV5BW86_9LEPT
MEKQIKEIMNAKGNTGPVERLEFLFKSLNTSDDQQEFMQTIWKIIKFGTATERSLSFAILNSLNISSQYKKEIREYLGKYKYDSDAHLLMQLLGICKSMDEAWAIEFVETIMKKAKLKKEWAIYMMANRSLISTWKWRHALRDFVDNIDNFDSRTVIDNFAFFLWVHPEVVIYENNELVDPGVVKKAIGLKAKILERHNEAYSHFLYRKDN